MARDPSTPDEITTALGAILTAAEFYHEHPALLYNTVAHHLSKYARDDQRDQIQTNMTAAAKRVQRV